MENGTPPLDPQQPRNEGYNPPPQQPSTPTYAAPPFVPTQQPTGQASGYGSPLGAPQQPYNNGYGVPPQETAQQKTNVLAVAGLISAFFVPLVGLILSIIGLSQIKAGKGTGRKIAIAGVVVSSLWFVLATLGIILLFVFGATTGVQENARDTERETDIKSLYSQVESYFVENNRYPTLANLNDSAWRDSNLRGLSAEALIDPSGADATLTNTPTLNAYAYEPTGANGEPCDNITTNCTKYTLTATLSDGSVYEKQSF